jgi:DedD protein
VTAAPAINPEVRTPSARVLQVQSAPPVVPPSVQRLFSGFLLQAGTFTNAQRAEELHAKLTLSGVPSTLETRVQVGPFKTRQEAEAAQEKLRELGIGSVLVAPKGSKH